MYLKSIEISGFKSFGRKTTLDFNAPITAIVGPNGSGKSNVAEAFRFVLGEQSMKSMRGKRGQDLIFAGSNEAGRANRASIKLKLDNSDRSLSLDYDEVTIERAVHRDGTNQYRLNGSTVRLRDVLEMLAGANIGPSGHHIISQGEADRVLAAHPRQRREMIEDALGLKAYQFKKNESEKKLAKTRENIERVSSLRREIEPHIRFLKKQVEKIERAQHIRKELGEAYREYLAREHAYVTYWREALAQERRSPEEELSQVEKELANAKSSAEKSDKEESLRKQLLELEKKISEIHKEKDEQNRKLGRIEGELSAIGEESNTETEEVTVSAATFDSFADEVKKIISEGKEADALTKARELFQNLEARVQEFVGAHRAEDAGASEKQKKREELTQQRDELTKAVETAEKQEEKLRDEYENCRKELEQYQQEERTAERDVFRLTTRQNELKTQLADISKKQDEIERTAEAITRELQDAVSLVGAAVRDYQEHTPHDADGNALSREVVAQESREKQTKRHREIEKMKARLEEVGGGSGEEVMREYEQLKERDAFLAHELADLEATAEKLVSLIEDLDTKLHAQFKSGLARINKEFQTFFSTLFGGGSASLGLTPIEKQHARVSSEESDGEEGASEADEDETETHVEEGIDISVSIPRKRIRGLQALSGGERSLVSIALIFAISQVNPPPFIVLDETDATLDESNARIYGEMVKRLADHSQIILITHNRETMSHAGVLYGVTMGGDAVSRVLSIQFEEAAKGAAR